jgi:hypothetical protein
MWTLIVRTLGTDVMILKIFTPTFSAENWQKITESCDRNIDPRLLDFYVVKMRHLLNAKQPLKNYELSANFGLVYK